MKQVKLTEKNAKKKASLKERASALEEKIELKDKTQGIALGTSKTNYSDPRITFSFCKEMEIDPSKFFTSALLKKLICLLEAFRWFYAAIFSNM